MESTQILLFVVVVILTGLLTFVGIQVFLILRETQKTLQKLNKILDDAGVMADTIVKPIVGIASFVEGLKGVKGIVDLLHDKATGNTQKKIEARVSSPADERSSPNRIPYEAFVEEESETRAKSPHTHISALQERGRRFFHRGGKPLTS